MRTGGKVQPATMKDEGERRKKVRIMIGYDFGSTVIIMIDEGGDCNGGGEEDREGEGQDGRQR